MEVSPWRCTQRLKPRVVLLVLATVIHGHNNASVTSFLSFHVLCSSQSIKKSARPKVKTSRNTQEQKVLRCNVPGASPRVFIISLGLPLYAYSYFLPFQETTRSRILVRTHSTGLCKGSMAQTATSPYHVLRTRKVQWLRYPDEARITYLLLY